MAQRSTGWLGALVAWLVSAVAVAQPDGAPTPDGPASLAAWSQTAWRTAGLGDEAAVVRAVEDVGKHRVLESLGAVWLSDSFESFAANLERRGAERAEAVSAASASLDEAIAAYVGLEGQTRDRAIAISSALTAALEKEMVNEDKAEVFGDPRIGRLEQDAVSEARSAEDRADWLVANELYGKLEVLFEHRRDYERDVERVTSRLLMIQLYAPRRYWELRNERRVAGGDEPLAAYNDFGDRYDEKLEGIRLSMLQTALWRASKQHVGAVGLDRLILSGLASVELLVTTPDLGGTFPRLRDEEARGRFLTGLSRLRAEATDRGVRTWNAATDILRRLSDLNAGTIGLPEEAVIHEFGVGAMAALDPYSSIIWPHELAEFRRSIDGQFVGIGVQIQYDEKMNIKVVTPLEGTPAQRAGIRSDDVIVGVDGHDARGFTLRQAVDTITGSPDTTVRLTVEREEGGERVERSFDIERRAIPLPTVKGWARTAPGDDGWDWMIDPEAGIGYIRLTNFTDDTTEDFDAAVRVMRASPAGLNGLILDLRFNPGGLLDQAVSISSRFVPEGLIVKTEDGEGVVRSEHRVRGVPEAVRLTDIPVVVLINEGSASASEIVSGAIQAFAQAEALSTPTGDFRALVIGERTFGKGSVQQVHALDPPMGTALMKLTTQHYKLRTGHQIHREPGSATWGVEPDLRISMLPARISEALNLRSRADLMVLDADGAAASDPEKPDPRELLDGGIDLQLQAALVLLQARYAGRALSVARAPGAATATP